MTAGAARSIRALVLTAIALAIVPAHAQEPDVRTFPNRPIHIVVPFPPGGPADILSRIIGKEMTASWGQPVVIENRPGADTAIGAEAVAKSSPDGYTLLAAMDSTIVLNPLFKTNLPYDPAKDLAAVSLGAKHISLLEVRADSRLHSVADLIAAMKAEPGRFNLGAGTINGRFAASLFGKLSGTTFTIIPFKGSSETMHGLLTGSVDMIIDSVATSIPLLAEGKFRALAKLSERPLPRFPDLPPLVKAAGIPEFGDVSTWIAFYAPAGTPGAVVGKIQRFIAMIYADPTVARRLDDAGIMPVACTPAELDDYVKSETARWRKIIRDNGNLMPE
jgi:tripartite-type tricarboxylate transporter receptor subunit TctC